MQYSTVLLHTFVNLNKMLQHNIIVVTMGINQAGYTYKGMAIDSEICPQSSTVGQL